MSSAPRKNNGSLQRGGRRQRSRSGDLTPSNDPLMPRRSLDRSRHPRRESHKTNHRHRASSRGRETRRHTILFCVLMAAYLTVASFNNSVSTIEPGSKVQPQSKWSRRKTAFQSKVVDTDDEAEHFLQTGQVPGQNNKILPPKTHITAAYLNYSSSPSNKMGEDSLLIGHDGFDWPPISTLLDSNGNIVHGANISGLLDFSIIGFPKTGTTSILRHLSDLTATLPNEHCDLVANGTAKLLKDIYKDHSLRLKESKGAASLGKQIRGIKCPQDISSDWSMHNYAKYFPRTKLIVGIRHPIFWFQSLYNFRVSNVPWKTMLHTSKLTKGCPPGSQGVCAWRANFHDFLARLGKTPLSSPSELKLLSLRLDPVRSSVGPVFLFDLSQLSEPKFRQDLRDFLGLSTDIPPFPRVDTSGRFDHISRYKRQATANKIDICDPEHAAIRSALMKKANASSVWIRDYFLSSSDVFVSNRRYLEAVLKSWTRDPCE
ncbi:hypothetical protein ACHAWF_007879 [Thalassiosira exigua]